MKTNQIDQLKLTIIRRIQFQKLNLSISSFTSTTKQTPSTSLKSISIRWINTINHHKQQQNSPITIISARMKLIFNYFIFPFTTISKLLKIPLRSIHLLQHQIKHSHVKSTYYHHSNKFSKIKFRFKFLLSHNINILLYFEFRTKINLSFINSTSYQQTNLPTMVNNGVKNYFLFFNFFHSSQL